MDHNILSPSKNAESLQEIRVKSLAGIGSLLKRQFFVYGVFFIGNIILARILAPDVFGIYAIVNFIVNFLATFSDVGIGASLIQKKGELKVEELSTVFWLQQMLSLAVFVMVFAAAPLVLKIYRTLPPVSVWLIRGMALSFVLASLKTIPAILMEKHLDFNKIAKVDIVETLAFQTIAIILALAGFGVWSFIIAAIARGALGTLMIYAFSPWRPALHYRFESVRGLMKFGLPYQGNTILSFIKDAVTPLFVGVYAGPAAVGYVNWARTFAFAPLVFSESFGRVAFPAFSKFQHDKEALRNTVERSVRMMTLVLFPITAIMVALGPEITKVIFTAKWLPGIKAFYFYCTSPLMIGIMLPLYSAILSLGRTAILLKMTLLLLFLEWGMGIPLVIKFGFSGIAFSQPVISAIFLLVYKYVLASEGISPVIGKNIRWQLIAALISGIAVKIIVIHVKVNLAALMVILLIGCVFYVAVLYLMWKSLLYEFMKYLSGVLGREHGSI